MKYTVLTAKTVKAIKLKKPNFAPNEVMVELIENVKSAEFGILVPIENGKNPEGVKSTLRSYAKKAGIHLAIATVEDGSGLVITKAKAPKRKTVVRRKVTVAAAPAPAAESGTSTDEETETEEHEESD